MEHKLQGIAKLKRDIMMQAFRYLGKFCHITIDGKTNDYVIESIQQDVVVLRGEIGAIKVSKERIDDIRPI